MILISLQYGKNDIQPSFFSPSRIFIMVSLLTSSIIIGGFVLPKALILYSEFPSTDSQGIVLTSYLGLIAPWIIGVVTYLAIRNKSISIDNRFLYFSHKALFGKSESKIINLENVEQIGHRKQAFVLPTGKGLIPVARIWLTFSHKDGHKEEIIVSEWDAATLKNIIFLIKGKFKQITFDTHIYRDSSEQLSGIHEYLKNSNV